MLCSVTAPAVGALNRETATATAMKAASMRRRAHGIHAARILTIRSSFRIGLVRAGAVLTFDIREAALALCFLVG